MLLRRHPWFILFGLAIGACAVEAPPTEEPSKEPDASELPTSEPTEPMPPEDTASPMGDTGIDEPLTLFERWDLQAFVSDDGTVEVTLPNLVQFDEDGTVRVFTDCNNCLGSYESGLDALDVADIIDCTRVACLPPTFESTFTSALQSAYQWEREGDELRIRYRPATYETGTMEFTLATEE
ncbi:MAG: META domain-containing protein [Myxococcota bacterium]